MKVLETKEIKVAVLQNGNIILGESKRFYGSAFVQTSDGIMEYTKNEMKELFGVELKEVNGSDVWVEFRFTHKVR